jgi:DNA-binding SARP family transcriptional activator
MITPIGAASQADDVQRDGEMQELALTITCFGRFEVRRNQHLINLGPSRSGQTFLRYLIAQPDYSASKDALIGLLWPDLSEEHARARSVHTTIASRISRLQPFNSLRQILDLSEVLLQHEAMMISTTV